MENEQGMSQWEWQEWGTTWKGVGIYHVTMVLTDRKPLLGTLVIPDNEPHRARVDLTPLGEQIKACVKGTQHYHPEVQLIGLRMMPDHVHIIFYVKEKMSKGIMTVVRGLWQGAKKIGREYTLSVCPNDIRGNEQRAQQEKEKPNDIRGKEQRAQYIDPLFREMPFVRVMSRRGQLETMMQYVRLNPQRLATKKLMPEYFYVQHEVVINGRTYAAVGNVGILIDKQRKPVHVRHKMEEAARLGDNQPLRDYMNSCVLAAREGAVMVSPFVSRHEKEVLAVLLKEKRSIIYLADNGFGDYYKPSSILFDACAAGKVLILSPWGHDDEKRQIRRDDCIALNGMAEEICSEA